MVNIAERQNRYSLYIYILSAARACIIALCCLINGAESSLNEVTSRYDSREQQIFAYGAQSACMISRFNEIIPFDRPPPPSSRGRGAPPPRTFLRDSPGILLKGKHLNQNVLIASPVAIPLFPLGLRECSAAIARGRGWRENALLKTSPKTPQKGETCPLIPVERNTGYVCAHASLKISPPPLSSSSLCHSFKPPFLSFAPSTIRPDSL